MESLLQKVHRVGGPKTFAAPISTAEADRLQAQLRHESIHLWRVNLEDIGTELELHERLGRGIGFPEGHCKNWDAFEDSFGYELNRTRGGVLLLYSADALAKRSPTVFLRLVAVISSMAERARCVKGSVQFLPIWVGDWGQAEAR